jgi:hypothetical protein
MDLSKYGVDEADFYEAIASFKGASKRLEKIAESKTKCIKILRIHQQSCNYKSGERTIS